MRQDEALATVDHPLEVPHLCRYFSELSPLPMIAVEGTTHVVRYLNAAFARLVGKEGTELVGRPFAEAVPEGETNGCLALLERVYRTGTAENLSEQEHRSLTPPAYWSYVVWAILGKDERPAGLMIQVTDVTEIALFRNQALEMNQALVLSSVRQHELTETAETLNACLKASIEGRDHFIAVLSHEIRNPLAPIRNGLQILKRAGNDPIVSEKVQSIMEYQLSHLVRLVDDLLDVSRLTLGKLELRRERVELATVVRNAVEASRALIEQQGHELTVVLPPTPILLDADPIRLVQVFQNLLNNAAKYSDRGGRIQFTAELASEGRPPPGEVVVRVKDAGIGIPAAQLPHVFEIFLQVDKAWERVQGGLGIGLSLVKGFVEMHGGRVEAHSDGLGKGSEFVVYLPVVVAERRLKSRPTKDGDEDARPSASAHHRILVVDDLRDNAESLALLLRLMGHEVATAYDGLEAVEAAGTFRPDVILLDIGLPKINGYEAARRIRAQPWGKGMVLAAFTGWGQEEDRLRAAEAGFDHHFVKPVAPAEIENLLVGLTPTHRPERSL
jgi:PAS domain S-box-containing protein